MDSEYNKMRRVLSLYDRLSSGKIIYLKDEINTTGVSDRSFKRDITEIRNYLAEKSVDGEIRKEVVYDRNRNCYYMTEKEDTLLDYQKIFAIAKILLGSKGLSCLEMNQIMEYLLSLCDDESKRKEIKKYLANEVINYQGPNHGKNLLSMLWEVAQAAEYERKVKILYQRLEKHKKVERILKPLGVLFSEYYFYMLAIIDGASSEYSKTSTPTIYRIDRIEKLEVLDEHFKIPYSEKFKEQEFRNQTPLMWGGEMKRLRFWCNGLALDAVLDKIPTAKVLEKENEKYLISAEVVGNGAELWLKGQEGLEWV